MRWIALIPLISFGLVSTAVAIKLLLLARRTREIPEIAISMSTLLLGAVGIPLAVLGRLPANFGTARGTALFAAGLAFVCLGLHATFIFPWNVFRRDSRWARWFVIAAGIALYSTWCAIVAFGIGGTDVKSAQAQIRPYAIALIALQLTGAIWSSAESFRYWGMQKRRLRLGLANPVVVQRFLWWGISNVATVVLGATMILSLLAGKMIMRDPFCLSMMGVMGSVLSVTWALSFFPPKAYIRWVEGRAAAG